MTPLFRMFLGVLLTVLLTVLFTEKCCGQTGTVAILVEIDNKTSLLLSFLQEDVATETVLTPLHAIVILELLRDYHLFAYQSALLK